jgi:hypothetical protein
MNLSKGFQLANRYYPLILVPIILDLLQLGQILRSVNGITLKVTIPGSLPSLTQIMNPPNQGGGGFMVNLPYGYLGNGFLIVLISIFFIAASAFMKGGFLGCILAGIREQEVNVNTYIEAARKYFGRFLALSLLVFAALLAFVPLALVFGGLALLFVIGFLILWFFLIFWDYIIVADDAGIIEAARISLHRVRADLGKVLLFLLPIVLITAVLSLLVSVLMASSPVLVVLAIALYAYFGTAVVFAMMAFYLDIAGGETGIDSAV